MTTMKYPSALLTLIFLKAFLAPCNSAPGDSDSCGGLLEGNGGDFEFPLDAEVDLVLKGGLVCVWILKLQSTDPMDINFILQLIGNGTTLYLYQEHEPTDTILTPLRLTDANMGETVVTRGPTLVIILSQEFDAPGGFLCSWDSSAPKMVSNTMAVQNVVTGANYFDTKEGVVHWKKFDAMEGVTLGLNFPMGYTVSLTGSVDFQADCDLADPCLCTYFGLYEVVQACGELREVSRICGEASNIQFDNLLPQLVAFVYIGNSTQNQSGETQLKISWHGGL